MSIMKNKYFKPIAFVVLIIIVIAIIQFFNLTRFFSLSFIKTQLNLWKYQLESQQLLVYATYFFIYVVVTALSIPGAAAMTLLGGALFGLVQGTILVSFASTIGATLSFLVSRFFLRESIENKFHEQYQKINEGIEKDGKMYLFALRLVPVFPFFVINLVMGITKIPTLVYMLVSQLGMLPGTIVYVNAGRALFNIESTSEIFTPEIWGAFALLALLPFVSKKVLRMINIKKIYKHFTRPPHYDANIVVIGAGSGGLISAYIAATVNATVYLIEKDAMGGDCLNRGCVPSKAILAASKYARMSKESVHFGVKHTKPLISFPHVMEHVHNAIATVAPHDSIKRYSELGVKCIKGTAKIVSPWTVEVNNKKIHAKSIIIATGGSPKIPEIPTLSAQDIVTSDTVWSIKTLPAHLIVIGGGPIGCELSFAFASLGSQVTIVQRAPQLLHKEEEEVSESALKILQSAGVTVLLQSVAEKAIIEKKKSLLIQRTDGTQRRVQYDQVLIAAGRQANTSSLGLEALKIQYTPQGTIATDKYLRTNIPNIYAVGDVTGPHQFTHIASYMAWFATVNALFGSLKKFAINYKIVPAVTYLSPEIARVGITEKEALAQSIEYETVTYNMDDLDRAIAEQKREGFIKVIIRKGSDKILGASVVAERGGEILGQFILAMKHNIGLNKILQTIYPYPTYLEAVKLTAGAWKKKNAPIKMLLFFKRVFKISLHKNKK